MGFVQEAVYKFHNHAVPDKYHRDLVHEEERVDECCTQVKHFSVMEEQAMEILSYGLMCERDVRMVTQTGKRCE